MKRKEREAVPTSSATAPRPLFLHIIIYYTATPVRITSR